MKLEDNFVVVRSFYFLERKNLLAANNSAKFRIVLITMLKYLVT